MLTAISRYGARVIPNTEQTIAALRQRGELVQGPHIAAFEHACAQRLGAAHAIATSYGRMAFCYILQALDLPPGGEIVFPALTFWVIPEIARVLGFTPVFADVDPATFTLDPASFERVITRRTVAVVPTHLYGLMCEMDPILEIARANDLRVIEDCAHAFGAAYRGRPAGWFGDAAFFSFQTLKPLNTYGGGLAVLHDAAAAQRAAALAAAEPWPSEARVLRRLLIGKAQRVFTRPRVFTWTMFPMLWAASWVHASPDVYLWEKIRPLDPLPDAYTERYSNVQAAIGLEGLGWIDHWTDAARAHAARMDDAFRDAPGVQTPVAPLDRRHVYYQYCIYTAERDALVRDCVRRGVDVETLHVDVCTRLPLFGEPRIATPGAERAAEAVQLPVYAGLTDAQTERVIDVVHQATAARTVRRAAPLATRDSIVVGVRGTRASYTRGSARRGAAVRYRR